MNKEKFLSRTFQLTVAVLIISTTLIIFNKIDGVIWSNTIQWILSSYAIKSVSEKWVESAHKPSTKTTKGECECQ